MDVKKIKYTQNLILNKIRIEKELEIISNLIDENTKDCEHLEVKVTDGPNNTARCLFCGKKLALSDDSVLTVDACSYKEDEYHKGFKESEKLARLNDLREVTIGLLLLDEDLTREGLIEELNTKLGKNQKIKKK